MITKDVNRLHYFIRIDQNQMQDDFKNIKREMAVPTAVLSNIVYIAGALQMNG